MSNYVFIDENEKRVVPLTVDSPSLETVLSCLETNPETIADFDANYESSYGKRFFVDRNRPEVSKKLTFADIMNVLGIGRKHFADGSGQKIPKRLSIKKIRQVLGTFKGGDKYLIEHWKRVSSYTDDNYLSFDPDEHTPFDIPEGDLTDSDISNTITIDFRSNEIQHYSKTYNLQLIYFDRLELPEWKVTSRHQWGA